MGGMDKWVEWMDGVLPGGERRDEEEGGMNVLTGVDGVDGRRLGEVGAGWGDCGEWREIMEGEHT